MDNIYVELTQRFNEGGLRAVLAGGQAVVLHRLALMSKDGDWILREEESALAHILGVLSGRGAHYRFGTPLDIRWLSGGWSAHLEFMADGLRIRTDFVTRPPRLDSAALARLWAAQRGRQIPHADAPALAEMKKTNREKDYAVIGELARRMTDPADAMLYSRSARDLMALARAHPDLTASLAERRPVLKAVAHGRDALETALDAERRQLMRANEERLARYMAAARRWAEIWPEVAREMEGLPLPQAHVLMCRRAEGTLPFAPGGVA